MTMLDSTNEAPPAQPFFPLWFRPLAVCVAVVATAAPLGGAVSGWLTGDGWAWPGGPREMGGAYVALYAAPGDPASRWPGEISPGPAVMVWLCVGLTLIAVSILAAGVNGVIDRVSDRLRGDPPGLGGRKEMLRLGLTESAARKRARNEFTSLQSRRARSLDAAKAAIRLGTNINSNTAMFIQNRDCTLVEGPTGSGKTWRLAVQRCWDAAGFLLVTTTKVDLIAAIYADRTSKGALEVFDPESITGWPTPMRWSLLSGCDQPEVAIRRASAMVAARPMGGTKDASFWEGKAAVLLRCYLYAAAVTDQSISQVQYWATSRTQGAVIEILRETRPDWASELAQILGSEADSAEDMMSACSALLDPLADPQIRAAVDVPIAESVDLADLVLTGTNTIALVSKGDDNSTAPIVATLAAEIHFLLDRHSQRLPQGRLDPPARLVLDEVNNVAPIPNLPDLMSDSGGRGISIWAFAHNKTQNMERWGRFGGEMFTDSPPCRIVLPGLRGDQELAELSRLCGEKTDWLPTATGERPQSRIRPVLSASQIRQLPDDVCLVIYRNAKPMLVHLRSVWEVKETKQRVLDSIAQFQKVVPPTVDLDIDDAGVKTVAPVARWA